MADVAVQHPAGRARPLLGVRKQPGRLALWIFRTPLHVYHHGKGRMLGHTFVLLSHIGRKTGQPHETVALVLRHRPESKEVVVCSNWGPDTDWMKNIRQRPAVWVEVGREAYEPEQRFLSPEESLMVVDDCLHQHPWRFRFLAKVFGWGDLRARETASDFVRTRPFVAFTPVDGHEIGRGASDV